MSQTSEAKQKLQHETLFKREKNNPILTAAHWPYPVNSVFNPGATLLEDGTTLLLCRVEDRSGLSHLCAARSKDGISNWVIDKKPTLLPSPTEYPEETWGIEDPRITYLPEKKVYAVAYTSYSMPGPTVSIALTKNFKKFERVGMVMPPLNKDAALLPHKICGKWAMIHRPTTSHYSHIWISFSADLDHWGDHKMILQARRGPWWDSDKIGLSPPVIKTSEGWLMIYHSVRHTASGAIYRIGLALFDLGCHQTCLRRSDTWVLTPEAGYERNGDVANVIFPCGYTIAEDGDTLRLYYGGADTCIGMVTGSLRELLSWLQGNSKVMDSDDISLRENNYD
ncbi:glycosidase [Paremcibacter congregatus]|uniref:Glycosidase n=1 Tax=Paremcibacter congregatus TaxID=2043170 RepID=A0A2G4YTX3_9PROT|nr:glycosidase [Paremcibacter congregatus]PHZ85778.1 glycosidase [Paremcibacter congregatus]QDE26739.1 glycosidase [Paremcibacter congregatus]